MSRIALAVAVFAACGSGAPTPDKTKDTPAPVHDTPAPAPPKPVSIHTDTAQPSLPTPADAALDNAPAVPVDKQFAGQTRDATWAGSTEAEVKKRLATLPNNARLESTECRESLCKLVVSGTSSGIATAIDAIQSEQGGLHGWAQNWILSAPEKRGDQLALTAYARFQRSTADQPSGED